MDCNRLIGNDLYSSVSLYRKSNSRTFVPERRRRRERFLVQLHGSQRPVDVSVCVVDDLSLRRADAGGAAGARVHLERPVVQLIA